MSGSDELKTESNESEVEKIVPENLTSPKPMKRTIVEIVLGALGSRATAVVSVLAALASIVGAFFAGAQLTLARDIVRQQEQDRLFEEFVINANDLCNSLMSPFIKEHFSYPLTEKFASDQYKISLGKDYYLENGLTKPDLQVTLIKDLPSDFTIVGPTTEVVGHAFFSKLLQLNWFTYQWMEPFDRENLWNVYRAYRAASDNINAEIRTYDDKKEISTIAKRYFEEQGQCYLSISKSISEYYTADLIGQTQIKFWVGWQ